MCMEYYFDLSAFYTIIKLTSHFLRFLRFNLICIKIQSRAIESFTPGASRRISGLKNKLHYVEKKKKTFARLVLVKVRAGGKVI